MTSGRRSALVTGAAAGIGEGVARMLAAQGYDVLVADVDEAGQAVADDVGGAFLRCDVTSLQANRDAVAAVLQRWGRLDVVVLNAGIATTMSLGDDFDEARYRRAMGVNLDGVVFGAVAALPALRDGGGDLVVTASMAGLTAVPLDPVYAANKHAVVGLVRSLGVAWREAGVRVNAVCPSFTDTAIVEVIRPMLDQMRTPLLPVSAVVDAFAAVLAGTGSGDCWFVQLGRDSEPFRFRNIPGPRHLTEEHR